jgi:hypothetical protein
MRRRLASRWALSSFSREPLLPCSRASWASCFSFAWRASAAFFCRSCSAFSWARRFCSCSRLQRLFLSPPPASGAASAPAPASAVRPAPRLPSSGAPAQSRRRADAVGGRRRWGRRGAGRRLGLRGRGRRFLKPGGGLLRDGGPQLGLDGQGPVGLVPPGHAPAQRTEQQHVGQHRQRQRAQLRGWLGRGELGPIGAGGVHGGFVVDSGPHGASCTDRPTRWMPARCRVSMTLTTVSYFTLRSALMTTAVLVWPALQGLDGSGHFALRELAGLVAGLEFQRLVLADDDLHDLVGLLGRLARRSAGRSCSVRSAAP